MSSNGEVKEQTAKQKVQLLQRQPDHNSAGPQKSSIPEEVAILAARPLPITQKDLARQPEGECDPESNIPCSCPRRQFTDPPDRLPFPPTKSNRKALEDYIKSHYKASAFNLCKRQLWPTTAGEPMRMHTAENAVPMYCRTPTKVPLHFCEEIKKGLDSDVMKGILEKVPAGEVDKWC